MRTLVNVGIVVALAVLALAIHAQVGALLAMRPESLGSVLLLCVLLSIPIVYAMRTNLLEATWTSLVVGILSVLSLWCIWRAYCLLVGETPVTNMSVWTLAVTGAAVAAGWAATSRYMQDMLTRRRTERPVR